MQTNQQPTAAQKAWREKVREYGSVISRQKPCVIHHCVGRTGMHEKTHIGHWWILPLTPDEHATMHRLPGRKARELSLFMELVTHIVMTETWDGVPFPHSTYQIIMRYHK